MDLQTLPKRSEWPSSRDPMAWERILDSLPEGSELIIDEWGNVTGVTLQIVCMLDEDNQSDECDNKVNN